MKKVAVILSGSGHLDGSEIREAVGTLWALSKHPVEVQCFAPDAPQTDVVDHVTRQPVAGQTRNQLQEAARIARGKILPLDQLSPSDFHALILPGGYGAAKNLSTFASQGAGGTVYEPVAQILHAFHGARKPIGAICIAPALLALTYKGKGMELTVGAMSEASQEIEKLGHKHIAVSANGCHVDASQRIVTTPAYMYDNAPLHEIFTGIEKLVKEVVAMIG